MNWNHSNTIGLAHMKCAYCHGFGMRHSPRRGTPLPCGCVFRAIFRACYHRFRECAEMEKRLSTVTLDWATGGSVGRRCYGRKIEEYMADFCGTAKRVLTASDHQIFRYHFLLGADFNLCCRQLHLDKGTFFRRVYRVMSILGREFAEMQPYGLYPVDEYFGTVLRRTAPVVESIEPARRRRRRKAAETEQPELLKIA